MIQVLILVQVLVLVKVPVQVLVLVPAERRVGVAAVPSDVEPPPTFDAFPRLERTFLSGLQGLACHPLPGPHPPIPPTTKLAAEKAVVSRPPPPPPAKPLRWAASFRRHPEEEEDEEGSREGSLYNGLKLNEIEAFISREKKLFPGASQASMAEQRNE